MFPFPIIIAAMKSPVPALVMSAGSNVSSSNSGFSACGNPGNTGTPGASASGGTAPYTYLWERIGGAMTNGPANCSNTAALNPTWGLPSKCDGDASDVETWRLTVTDDDGRSESDTITVTLSWSDIT